VDTRYALGAVVSAYFVLCSGIGGAAEVQRIRASDLNRYFNQRYSQCHGKSKTRNAVDILSLAFHDFAGDGSEEAIVVGSSCNAGTSGPDIHSVYRLSKTRQIKELKIVKDVSFRGHSVYDDLIGNRNFTFEIQDGHLCEAFTDSSGREKPLTVCYKLHRDEFVIEDVTRGPTYRASFDCVAAEEAWARTVCGTKDLANADIEVQSLYQKLEELYPEQKDQLETEQRGWLKMLNALPISKFYGDALQDAFAVQEKELKSRLK
jgi:molybdopterin converting factor small subunit